MNRLRLFRNISNLTIIISFNVTIVFAQTDHPILGNPSRFGKSLRGFTTYGLFDTDGDDWLKLTDRPQELGSVDGFQIYTLLSNITTGRDRFASDISGDNRFAIGLIGIPSKIRKLNIGLAVARGRISLDNLYGKGSDGAWGNRGIDDDGDGFVDNYSERGFGDDEFRGAGNVSETMTNVRDWDINGDGIDEFQSSDVASAEAEGRADFNELNFIVAGGWELSERISLGLSFTRDSDTWNSLITEKYSLTPSSNNPAEIEPLGWSDTRRSIKINDTDDDSRKDNRLSVGAKLAVSSNLSLEGKITVNRYNQTRTIGFEDLVEIDYNPNGVGNDAPNNNSTSTFNFDFMEKATGTQLELWSKGDYSIDENTKLLIFFNAGTLPGKYEETSTLRDNLTFNNPDGEFNHSEKWTSNDTFNITRSGDLSGSQIGFAGHFIKRIESNVLFGLGFGMNRSNQSLETNGSVILGFEDIWEAGLVDSYTFVNGSLEGSSRFSLNYDTKDGVEATSTEYYFPVALEITVYDRFIARIAAQYLFTHTQLDNSEFELAPLTLTLIRLYDDPFFDDINETTEDEDHSSSVIATQAKTSNTSFRFGFGWQINKAVNIDFAGTAKLTDLTEWRLSLSLKL